jgi:mevalonate pyrophosphate decarboxylase
VINTHRDANILCATMRTSKAWHICVISIARWIEEASAAAYALDAGPEIPILSDARHTQSITSQLFALFQGPVCWFSLISRKQPGPSLATEVYAWMAIKFNAISLLSLSSGQEVSMI